MIQRASMWNNDHDGVTSVTGGQKIQAARKLIQKNFIAHQQSMWAKINLVLKEKKAKKRKDWA